MFTIGKSYNFRTIEWGEETSWSGRVVAVESTLIKVQQGTGPSATETIINTVSQNFVRAELSRHQ